MTQAVPAGQVGRDHDVWMRLLTEGQGPKPAPLRLRNGSQENPRIVPSCQLEDRSG